MADGSYQLFTLAVDTRAPLLASTGAKARGRAALELEWAQRRGIIADIIKADSATGSESPVDVRSVTPSSTATDNGMDAHGDTSDDITTSTVSDDVNNDPGT